MKTQSKSSDTHTHPPPQEHLTVTSQHKMLLISVFCCNYPILLLSSLCFHFHIFPTISYFWKALLSSLSLQRFLNPKILTGIKLQIKLGEAEMYLKFRRCRQTGFGTNNKDDLWRKLETDDEQWGESSASEDALLIIFSIFDNFTPRKKDWIMNQIFNARKLTGRVPLTFSNAG